MTRKALMLAAVVLVTMLGACSDESASAEVCDARSNLEEDVDLTADDFAAGDLAGATDRLSDVGEDLGNLQDAVRDLGDEQRDELEPQVDDLQDQIADLGNAESADERRSQLDEVMVGVQSMIGQIGDELDCS